MPYITVRENKAKWWITVQGLNYNEVSTVWSLELETEVKRRFLITEKAPTTLLVSTFNQEKQKRRHQYGMYGNCHTRDFKYFENR